MVGLPESDGWGELEFQNAAPDAGREWTDDGDHRERRQLKHRADGDSRTVPVYPELVALLREHLERFGTTTDGCLFTGIRGTELPNHHLPASLDRRTQNRAHARGTEITAGTSSVRSASRLPLYVAQRWSASHPGR